MNMASNGSMADGMGGMHMDDIGSCKVGSMLWNWYTIDACFISPSWHITSRGMFAGSCIGVILLVMSLEFLRRSAKEYDRYIIRQFQRSLSIPPLSQTTQNNKSYPDSEREDAVKVGTQIQFRPNLMQQAVRATFHMLQFAAAYFVMLLAMYYNGYLIICIIIGAWLGAFVFQWETINLSGVGPQEEATLCCG
ncbi:hypothetical protein HYFRA_00009724 [Hymenoscyphus fraxineus]|uniref:Copper transport protein n=1 Tax=Hymenoscyphus fraxineus TaxID=746836 RepID=A0A9N9KTY3_9HELO|nr:hypothetical protein HYFRA_00009724 [Hymenoscyphus fraxineus]